MLYIKFTASEAFREQVNENGPIEHDMGPFEEVNYGPNGDLLNESGTLIAYTNRFNDFIVKINGHKRSFTDICIYTKD